jgi:ABC-2 type transport system ATP-binding protein
MSAAIELRELRKHFGKVRAVDGISIEVKERALFGLIGPNGAGKTTTFGLLSGFLHPTSGEVLIRGEPLSPSRPPVGKVLALPQDAQLPDRMRVLETLVLLGRFGGLAKADASMKAERALQRVGLGDLAQRRVGELSHGQRRRVGIAQTLIGEDEVILLDEPTAGLDARSAAELRLLIKDLHQDRTIVLSSHNLQEVEQLCDSAAILDHGKIVASGSMESIKGTSTIVEVQLARPPADPDKVISALRALAVVRSAKLRESGVAIDLELAEQPDASGDDVTNQVLRVLLEQGASVKGVERGKSLEERFLEETKGAQ